MNSILNIIDEKDLKEFGFIPNLSLPNKWKFVYGDILDAEEKCIVHIVNCRGVMGAGVALAIKNKWPNVYEQYKILVDNTFDKKRLLGLCYFVDTVLSILPSTEENKKQNKTIANCFAQYTPGTAKRELNYEFLCDCLNNLRRHTPDDMTYAMPYQIGCGLAGGDWNIVYNIILHYLKDRVITFYVKV